MMPTFPNAKHVVSRAEYAQESDPAAWQGFSAGVFEDSVLPVTAAGQAEIVEERRQSATCCGSAPRQGITRAMSRSSWNAAARKHCSRET